MSHTMRRTISGFRFTAWRHAVELAEMPDGQWFWHVRDHAYAHKGQGTGYARTMAEAEKAGDRSAEMSLERKGQWSD